MQFYQCCNIDGYFDVQEMQYASTAHFSDGIECFLIYAKDIMDAWKLANEKNYNGKNFTTLYNIDYKGFHYDIVENVIA